MPNFYKLLGRQIAFYRRRQGFTQEKLAELTDYSVDFIGLIERGISAPAVQRLEDIAKALQVEVWELFKDPEQTQLLSSRNSTKPPKKRRKTAARNKSKGQQSAPAK